MKQPLVITEDQFVALVRDFATEVRRLVDEKIGALAKQVDALDARMAAVEARPELRYMGTWKQGETYTPGMLATHQGSLWHCHAETTKAPPSSEWQLCAKRGRDGKDAGTSA